MEEITVLILKYFTSNCSKQPLSFEEICSHFKNRISTKDVENALIQLVEKKSLCFEKYIFQEELKVYWMCSKSAPYETSMEEQNQVELERKISELKQEVKKIEGEIQLKESEYKKEYVAHLDRLHQYNDAKDAALSVLGQLASIEEVRTKDLYSRFGLDLDD